MKKRVRITKVPNYKSGGMHTGDQDNYGLYRGGGHLQDYLTGTEESDQEVKATEPKLSRQDAKIEAEKGEFRVLRDLSRITYIGGNKHSQGGTPIDAQPGDYIVSDYTVVHPALQQLTGFASDSKRKKDNTVAAILKKFVDHKDYNRLSQVIDQASRGMEVDPFTLRTAATRLPQYTDKIQTAMLVGELSKALEGKDYTIPQMAIPALQKFFPQPEPEQEQPMNEEEMMMMQQPMREGQPMMRYGGLPVFQTEGYYEIDGQRVKILDPQEVTPEEEEARRTARRNRSKAIYNRSTQNPDQEQVVVQDAAPETEEDLQARLIARRNRAAALRRQNQPADGDIPSWFKLWTESSTVAGRTTPTGQDSRFQGDPKSVYNRYRYWRDLAGREFADAKDFQRFVYSTIEKNNPDALKKMWEKYGMTKAGDFADGYFGARSADLMMTDVPPGTTTITTNPPGTTTITTNPPGTTTITTTPVLTTSTTTRPVGGDLNFVREQPTSKDWFTEDKMRAMYAMTLNPTAQFPMLNQVSLPQPETVMVEPYYAPITSQMNSARQSMEGSASPQMLRNFMSSAIGQGVDGVNNLTYQTAVNNADRQTNVRSAAAEMKAKEIMANAAARDTYMANVNKTIGEFNKESELYDAAKLKTIIEGMGNARKAEVWNNSFGRALGFSINPDYFMPGLQFSGGKNLFNSASGTGGTPDLDAVAAEYNTALSKFSGDKTAAMNWINLKFPQLRSKSTVTTNSAGDTDASSTFPGNITNAQQLMSLFPFLGSGSNK